MANDRTRTLTRRTVLGGALAAGSAAAFGGSPAAAQAAYPSRSIRLLVPFAPGGTPDIVARIIADPLAQRLGQSVYVENRAGGGGNIGIKMAASAEPDGYTLLVTSTVIMINPALYKVAPFDPQKDFKPIGELATAPMVLFAHPKLGVKTLKDLEAHAKANPGKLDYASPGVGTQGHITAELIKLRTGLDINHIPYPGGGRAAQGVLAGDTLVGCTGIPTVEGFIHGGTLQPLVVTGRERWFSLPNVPTMIEAGYPDFVSDSLQSMLAPAATPDAIVRKVSEELAAVLKQPEVIERARKAGWQLLNPDPQALARRIARDVPELKTVIERAGIERR